MNKIILGVVMMSSVSAFADCSIFIFNPISNVMSEEEIHEIESATGSTLWTKKSHDKTFSEEAEYYDNTVMAIELLTADYKGEVFRSYDTSIVIKSYSSIPGYTYTDKVQASKHLGTKYFYVPSGWVVKSDAITDDGHILKDTKKRKRILTSLIKEACSKI